MTASDLARGEQLLELGRAQEASTVARRLLSGDPDDADALWLFVAAALSLGDPAALDASEQLLRLQPEEPRSYLVASRATALHAGRDTARRYADRAIALEPDLSYTHRNRGYVDLVLGVSTDDGLAAARTAVRIDPDSADLHRLLGALLLQRGQLPAAEESLRAALAIDPTQVAARDDLARLRVEMRDTVGGAQRFVAELAERPGDTRVAHNLMVTMGTPITYAHSLLVLPALILLFPVGRTATKVVVLVSAVLLVGQTVALVRRLRGRMPERGGRLVRTALRRDPLLLVLLVLLVVSFPVMYAGGVGAPQVADPAVTVFQCLVLGAATVVRAGRAVLGRGRLRPLL